MKLRFLGTAAAEGIPALWCDCPVCKKAFEDPANELRRRCSYLIDNDTIVDFGPDSFWQSIQFGIDLTRIERVIVTHAHEDHIQPDDLCYRAAGFSHVDRNIELIASDKSMELIRSQCTYSFKKIFITPRIAEPGKWLQTQDMELLPIPADHAPGLAPMIYVIRRNGKSLLIANDTGILQESSWQLLEGIKLDTAVLECTCVFAYPDMTGNHLGVNTTIQFRDKLLEMNCITLETPVFVNHFSHNGKANHAELADFFSKHNMTVARDGLQTEI